MILYILFFLLHFSEDYASQEKKDYYTTLGVSKNESYTKMKEAYKTLALKYHPDRNPGNKEAEDKFKNVSIAWEVLSDPEKKEQYDKTGIHIHQQKRVILDDIFIEQQNLLKLREYKKLNYILWKNFFTLPQRDLFLTFSNPCYIKIILNTPAQLEKPKELVIFQEKPIEEIFKKVIAKELKYLKKIQVKGKTYIPKIDILVNLNEESSNNFTENELDNLRDPCLIITLHPLTILYFNSRNLLYALLGNSVDSNKIIEFKTTDVGPYKIFNFCEYIFEDFEDEETLKLTNNKVISIDSKDPINRLYSYLFRDNISYQYLSANFFDYFKSNNLNKTQRRIENFITYGLNYNIRLADSKRNIFTAISGGVFGALLTIIILKILKSKQRERLITFM